VLVADPALANDVLGWDCRFDVRDMVAHAWEFQGANPHGYRAEAPEGRPGSADPSWQSADDRLADGARRT
jgi:hypothetical protein